MTITIIAMSKERYEIARMMPEMACMKILDPKDPRENDFMIVFETQSVEEFVTKIAGIAEAYVHCGVYTHLMLIETRNSGGACFGSSHTIDLDKIPKIEIQ